MVGWAPVLEQHTPLAPDGPSTSYSTHVAPIIRRHARPRGEFNVVAGDSAGHARRVNLGTRSVGELTETRSAAATRVAAEAAQGFDENRPMPGEGLPSPPHESSRSVPFVASTDPKDVHDAFRGLPAWLGDCDEDEDGSETSEAARDESHRGDDLRGAVGEMRRTLEAVGVTREAHLAEVRAFLEVSPGRKPVTGADTIVSPKTQRVAYSRTKAAETETSPSLFEDGETPFFRYDRARVNPTLTEPSTSQQSHVTRFFEKGGFADPMGEALGLPSNAIRANRRFQKSSRSPNKKETSVPLFRNDCDEHGLSLDKENFGNAPDRPPHETNPFTDEKRRDNRLKARWRAYETEKFETKKRESDRAAIARLAAREAALELDARRAEQVRQRIRALAEKERGEIRVEEQTKLDAAAAAAAAAAELAEATRKHKAELERRALEHQFVLDEREMERACAVAAEAGVRNAAALLEADRQFEQRMISERTRREQRVVWFAAAAQSATVTGNKEEPEFSLSGSSAFDGSQGIRVSKTRPDFRQHDSTTAASPTCLGPRYIDAETGAVVGNAARGAEEASAERAVDLTLERGVDASLASEGGEATVSLLRLQLRAVSTLLEALTRSHRERLLTLHDRYVEVDVQREAQDRLLRFASVENDIRAARGLKTRRHGKWTPPRNGVFLNSGVNANSHNANASHGSSCETNGDDRAAVTAQTDHAKHGDRDPFKGSLFSRSVLRALGDKHLMKTALGVFAAGAAFARARRAYCHKVWRRNAAPAARVALRALRDQVSSTKEKEKKADAHYRRAVSTTTTTSHDSELFFEDAPCVTFVGARCVHRSIRAWVLNVSGRKARRNALALSAASHKRSTIRGAFGQWKVVRLHTERTTHSTSLALSFKRRRGFVNVFHVWQQATAKGVTTRLKLRAATPGEGDAQTLAKASLEKRFGRGTVGTGTRLTGTPSTPATPTGRTGANPSQAVGIGIASAKKVAAALEACARYFENSPRRVAVRAAREGIAEILSQNRRRFVATDADVRWIALVSPHMRRARSKMKAELDGEAKTAKPGARRVSHDADSNEAKQTNVLTQETRPTQKPTQDVAYDLFEEDLPPVHLTASARIIAAQAFESDRTRARARAVAVASARDAVAARDTARFLVERAFDIEQRAATGAASRASDRLAKAKALADADDAASPSLGIASFGLEDASGGVARARAEAARCESVARANALAKLSQDATRRALADADAARARAIAAAAVATAASQAAVTAEKISEIRANRDASTSEVSAAAEEACRRERTLRDAAERQRAFALEAREDMKASPEAVSLTATAAAERTELAAEQAAARAVEARDEFFSAETAAETARVASISVATPLLDALENARDALALAGRWREDASSSANAAETFVSELSANEAAADAVLNFWATKFANAAQVETLASREASNAAREAASSDPRAAAARRDAVSKRADADRAAAEARSKRAVADDAYANADAVAVAAEAQLAEAREDTRVISKITGEYATEPKKIETTSSGTSGTETADDLAGGETYARATRTRVTAATFAAASDFNTEAALAERRASELAGSAAAAESRATAGFSKNARQAHAAHREAYELATDAQAMLERARVHAGKVAGHATDARKHLAIAMEETRKATQVDVESVTPAATKVAEVCARTARKLADAVDASEKKAACDVAFARRTACAYTSKLHVKTLVNRLSVAEGTYAAAAEREAFCVSTARMARSEHGPETAVSGNAKPFLSDDNEDGDGDPNAASSALVIAAEATAATASREAVDARGAVVDAKSALEEALREASRDAAREVAAKTRAAAAAKVATETRLLADEATTETVAAAAAARRALASMTRMRAEHEEVRVKQAAKKASVDAETRATALAKAERDAAQAVAASKKRAARAAAAEARRRDAAEDAAERVEAARVAAADEARAVAKHNEAALAEALALECARRREVETAKRAEAAATFAAEAAVRALKTEQLRIDAIKTMDAAAKATHAVEVAAARDATRRAEERREVKRSVMASAAADTAFASNATTIAAVNLEKAYRFERERTSREVKNENARAAVEAAETAARASRDATEQHEAEQNAHREAELMLLAATARNNAFLAVVQVDEMEKMTRVAMERAVALAADRVWFAETEALEAVEYAKKKRNAAAKSQRAAAQAEQRRAAAEAEAEAELANAEALAIEAAALDGKRAMDERDAASAAAEQARRRADQAACDATELRRKLDFDERDFLDKETNLLDNDEDQESVMTAALERANERAAAAAEAAERAFQTVALMESESNGGDDDPNTPHSLVSSEPSAANAATRAKRAEAIAQEAARNAEKEFALVARLELERERLTAEARDAEARASAVASSRAAAENAAAQVFALERQFMSTKDEAERRRARVLEHVKAQHAAEVREAETVLARTKQAESAERLEAETSLATVLEKETTLAELKQVSQTAMKRAFAETGRVTEARAATKRAVELEREAVFLEKEANDAVAASAMKQKKKSDEESRFSTAAKKAHTPASPSNQLATTQKEEPSPEMVQAKLESRRALDAKRAAENDAERAASAANDAVSRAGRLALAMETETARASVLTQEANARAASCSANAANARAEAERANARARAADAKAREAKGHADVEAKQRLKRSTDELTSEKNKAVRAAAAARLAKSKADVARAAAEAEKARASRCAEAAERARKDAGKETARAKKQKELLAKKTRAAEATAAIKETEIRRRVEEGKVEACTKAAVEAVSRAAETATHRAMEEAVRNKVRESSAAMKADADAAANAAETRAAVAKATADTLATADAREALAVALAEASAHRDAADAATRERDAALAEANTTAATRERRAVEAARDAAAAERVRLAAARDDAEARAAAATARAEAEAARALEAERAVLETQEARARDVEQARFEAEAQAAALKEAEATARAESLASAARDAETAWIAEGKSSKLAERNARGAVEALVAAVAEAELVAAARREDAKDAATRRDATARAADAEERRREAVTNETREKLGALERRARAAEETASLEAGKAHAAHRAQLAAEEASLAAERRAVAVAAGVAGAFGFVAFGEVAREHERGADNVFTASTPTNQTSLCSAFDAVAGTARVTDSQQTYFVQGAVAQAKLEKSAKSAKAKSVRARRMGKTQSLFAPANKPRPAGLFPGPGPVADDRASEVSFESPAELGKRKTTQAVDSGDVDNALDEAEVDVDNALDGFQTFGVPPTLANVATFAKDNTATTSSDFTFAKTPSGESLFSVDLFAGESPSVSRTSMFAARRADARRAAANASRNAVRQLDARNRTAKRKRRRVEVSVSNADKTPSTSVAPRTPFPTASASPFSPHTDGGDSLFSIDLDAFPMNTPETAEFVISANSLLVRQTDQHDVLGLAGKMHNRVLAKKTLREMQRVLREEKTQRATLDTSGDTSKGDTSRSGTQELTKQLQAAAEKRTPKNSPYLKKGFSMKRNVETNPTEIRGKLSRSFAFDARTGRRVVSKTRADYSKAGPSSEKPAARAITGTTGAKIIGPITVPSPPKPQTFRGGAYPVWFRFQFRKWVAFSENAKLTRRVFADAVTRVERRRVEDAQALFNMCRAVLRKWRTHAVRTWSARRERRALWRAKTFHDATVSLKHFVAWVVFFETAVAEKKVDAFKNSAFHSWRALTKHRNEVRRRLLTYRAKKQLEVTMGVDSGTNHPLCVVKAWRAWRGVAATGRAATQMRRKALKRFIYPVLASWRAVVIAALLGKVTRELRVAVHGRNGIWRAWRGWVLGKGSVRLATGANAPTPPVPQKKSFSIIPQKNNASVPSFGNGGRAVFFAGAVARRIVLGRVVFAAWRGAASSAGGTSIETSREIDLTVDATRPRLVTEPNTVGTQTQNLLNNSAYLDLDPSAVLAAAEAQFRGNSVGRLPPPRARTVAAAVAAEFEQDSDGDDLVSELSEVPPIAGVDPEVYARARLEWLRRGEGR